MPFHSRVFWTWSVDNAQAHIACTEVEFIIRIIGVSVTNHFVKEALIPC